MGVAKPVIYAKVPNQWRTAKIHARTVAVENAEEEILKILKMEYLVTVQVTVE